MTLLRLMLRAHPRVAIAPETRFLLGAYENRAAYGDLRKAANRQALAEWIVAGAGTRFGDLGLDPRTVAAEIASGPPTLGSAIGIVLRAYARRLGKPRWGDKRPGYVQHLDVLLRLFPDAQIVHVVRDGRDCVESLKCTPWWRMGTYHAVATWTQAIDAGRAAARRLPPDAYIETQYECLVADPESELRRLCAYLEEDYAPVMAVPGGSALAQWRERRIGTGRPSGASEAGLGRGATGPRGLRSPEPGTLESRTLEPARLESRRFESWETELCETVMAERLAAYGYPLRPMALPPVQHLARYTTITAHRRLAARKRAVWDRGVRAGEPQPVASRLDGAPTEEAPAWSVPGVS